MTNPDDIVEPILAETRRVLVEMGGTKDLEERKIQSEIAKNLCESLGVFFDAMNGALMSEDMSDMFEEDEEEH
jgi:hypothetical protein